MSEKYTEPIKSMIDKPETCYNSITSYTWNNEVKLGNIMKYFLVKPLRSAQGVYILGWGVNKEKLEHTQKGMVDAEQFRVISEHDLYKIVTEIE